jgi:hypothetical protein
MRCPAALRVNMQLYFSFMTPDGGHDMWFATISRNEDSDSDAVHWAEGGANRGSIQNCNAEGG